MDDIDVKRLRLRKGDIVVVEFPTVATGADLEAIRSALNAVGHRDTPIIMMTGGITLSVMDPADVEGMAP